jgi:hypothetical protein
MPQNTAIFIFTAAITSNLNEDNFFNNALLYECDKRRDSDELTDKKDGHGLSQCGARKS